MSEKIMYRGIHGISGVPLPSSHFSKLLPILYRLVPARAINIYNPFICQIALTFPFIPRVSL